MTQKSHTKGHILTKEASWNSIFQQSFDLHTEAEKGFKIDVYDERNRYSQRALLNTLFTVRKN